jgi:hypothetical protein
VVRLDTRSAVSQCCGSRSRLAAIAFAPLALFAQITTGEIEGTVRAVDGNPLPGRAIPITGSAGFRTVITSDVNGRFSVTLPYGRYQFSGAVVFAAPLETTRFDLLIDESGAAHGSLPETSRHIYPEGFSLTGLLASREPSSVTEPLNFTGLSDNRLAVESQRGFSWTDTRFKVNGMNATDSYQPGLPVVLPDVEALSAVAVHDVGVGVFLAEPRAVTSWHGALSSAGTGAMLSSSNLPAPPNRGLVQQADRYNWFTRDRLELGGPLTRWADFYASASGQWDSQTEPLAAPGSDQRSRLLFANARGRVRAGPRDQFDALYSGSRIDLSGGGIPAGLEALMGNRLAPSFVLPGGFSSQPEVDHMDFIQAAWTHLAPAGVVEVRYGYSTAHLDTDVPVTGQSRIELLGGAVSGAPPLGNFAVRTRQGIEAAWQKVVSRHRIVAGGGWQTSLPRNRFTVPSGMNVITADGAPAFVVEFNTPVDSRELVRSLSSYFADHVRLMSSLSFDVGVLADFSRGSLPSPARPDLISWNSVSPRAGFAWQVPHSRGLTVRGTYSRSYVPLAGRYLDFGNPNSLGGSVYQWNALTAAAPFQPAEQGNLLLRFGGPYSSISPTLRRPYADEFDVGAEIRLAPQSVASLHLFRRDEKDRIAAIDTGVPAQAFTPVTILDPGPDGISGTFDDQRLTVYAQNPSTLGQDRYLLTNPAGLRTLHTGLLAEAGTQWRQWTLHASFVAEKSYGPTNPGDSIYENDPGVIGSLFLDPNATIHTTGRSFVDRAYVGKIQTMYRLKGGIEIASVADYVDGLVFARQLLVTGLPQGPFLVATTVRGSPEGGNRAQYVVNWNLRISRQLKLPFGRLTVAADLINVINAGQRVQENDLSGPSFNQRLPVAIQPPRFLRMGLRYEF